MLKRLLLVLLLVALASPAVLAQDLWLHVRVDEAGEDGEQVRVNIPFRMIEAVLPAIEHENLRGGKVIITEDLLSHEVEKIDLNKIWAALRDTPDGEYVTVKSRHENVRVAKEAGFLMVNVDGGEDQENEKVRVRVPLEVVEALLSAEENELDVLAALTALGRYDGDIVTVEEAGGTTVRVWIDDQMEAL